MIYPYRSNQKKKNTEAEKLLLKKRYLIEHVNAWFKNCKRLTMRVDRLDETFNSFLKLKLLTVTIKRLQTRLQFGNPICNLYLQKRSRVPNLFDTSK